MRHLFIGLVVAATTVLVPVWALASNQEVAERIAANLRESGQLQNYKIGVKFQDGTAWLRGRVSGRKQLEAVLQTVSDTIGVDRVVNNLTNGDSSRGSMDQPNGAIALERFPQSVIGRKRANRSEDSYSAAHATRRLQQVVDNQMEMTRVQPIARTYRTVPVRTAPVRQVAAHAPIRQPRQVHYPTHASSNRPIPVAYIQGGLQPVDQPGPVPAYSAPMGSGVAPARYDQAHMPNCAWPSYAAYPNYAALTYPKQYSPTAWPYIGPFYPYPQVPLGWRKVTLEWDDGWWMLDFKD